MTGQAKFEAAHPFQDDVLALPVADRDVAAQWYGEKFAMTEVERKDDPHPTVIMERDGIRMGFAENGGDSSNDGGAVLINDAAQMKEELDGRGVETGEWRIDEHDDGKKYQVFFVIAPDGLCFYFHQLIESN